MSWLDTKFPRGSSEGELVRSESKKRLNWTDSKSELLARFGRIENVKF